MQINIRKVEAGDLGDIDRLIHDFAEFERLSAYCQVDENRLYAAMFAEDAIVEGLVACDDEAVAGYALFYPNFSSFRGEMGLHLEDLYVRKEYRGKGVGAALLQEIARTARQRGLVRLDFMVQQGNLAAAEFYKKLGAETNADERHFKFSGDTLEKLSRK